MATPKSIGQLLTDLDEQWQDAGYASSGAEGMAAMGTIRRTQAALVRACLVASEQATEPSTAREHLQKAHALLVEILGSQQADEHPGLIEVRAYVEGLLAKRTDPMRRQVALVVMGIALASSGPGCAHPHQLDERSPPAPVETPPPYRPVRPPLPVVQHLSGGAPATAAPADRPHAISGRAITFGDGTVGVVESRWAEGGALEWVTTWRSEVPVKAFTTWANGRELCLATADGRVGCLMQTNQHGQQVDWAYGADARSLAVFRSGVAWHLCLVRGDGSVHCETIGLSWPVEAGGTLTFRRSAPPEHALEQSERLEHAFQALGPLKQLFADPTCAIDARDRLWCDDGAGFRLLLSGVRDATPECALMLDGTVQCRGANGYGQLGNGQRSSGARAHAVVAGLDDVVQVASSGVNACARKRDGSVFCWGTSFGPDFPPAAAGIPLCRLQPRPPLPPEEPCPAVSGRGDDVCGRARYNAQRFGRDQSPIVLREPDEQCAGPGEDYVPVPTRITLVDHAVWVAVSHAGVTLVRSDGMVVEGTSGAVRDIVVR